MSIPELLLVVIIVFLRERVSAQCHRPQRRKTAVSLLARDQPHAGRDGLCLLLVF